MYKISTYIQCGSAKLRDAGDNFSKSLQQYAASEVPGLRQGLSAIAECFAAVQDHRNVLVNRLENKVVQAFTVYETRCKQAKFDVKQHNIAHTKELTEHKSFEKIKTKSTQQFQLAKAETKFKKAAEEANRSAQILNDQVTDFERQKIRDLKKVFGDFMLSEMLFYAKALEIYTRRLSGVDGGGRKRKHRTTTRIHEVCATKVRKHDYAI